MNKQKQDIYKFFKKDSFHIWTDGSYRPDGSAACAYLIYSAEEERVVKKCAYASRGSTINQMELRAIGMALDYPGLNNVVIYSDSAYAIQCLTIWRAVWVKRDWKTPLGEPVKNRDLIESIGKKIDVLGSCKFVKVSSHSGDYFNTVVDNMAVTLTSKMIKDRSITTGEYDV